VGPPRVGIGGELVQDPAIEVGFGLRISGGDTDFSQPHVVGAGDSARGDRIDVAWERRAIGIPVDGDHVLGVERPGTLDVVQRAYVIARHQRVVAGLRPGKRERRVDRIPRVRRVDEQQCVVDAVCGVPQRQIRLVPNAERDVEAAVPTHERLHELVPVHDVGRHRRATVAAVGPRRSAADRQVTEQAQPLRADDDIVSACPLEHAARWLESRPVAGAAHDADAQRGQQRRNRSVQVEGDDSEFRDRILEE
jgi:hypothetical protein